MYVPLLPRLFLRRCDCLHKRIQNILAAAVASFLELLRVVVAVVLMLGLSPAVIAVDMALGLYRAAVESCPPLTPLAFFALETRTSCVL